MEYIFEELYEAFYLSEKKGKYYDGAIRADSEVIQLIYQSFEYYECYESLYNNDQIAHGIRMMLTNMYSGKTNAIATEYVFGIINHDDEFLNKLKIIN